MHEILNPITLSEFKSEDDVFNSKNTPIKGNNNK